LLGHGLTFESGLELTNSLEKKTLIDRSDESSLYARPEFKDAARAAILRAHVDRACAQIISGQLSRQEALELAARAMREVQSLVGEDRELFDRIYGARMQRLIEQFTGSEDKE